MTLNLAISSPNTAIVPPRFASVSVKALYIHIPFCFHKCHYCDFYSITRQTPQRMEEFVDRILAEADFWTDSRRGPAIEPATIFFGGGTPSLLPQNAMQRLIVGLRNRFDLSQTTEWTVEINPATADADYCQMLRELGVDRLSFGAQSFRTAELALLERHHDPADVPRNLEMAQVAGFRRLNLDLIFALPGQSLADWSHSLESAIALGTTHLSCYSLTYEPNTAMAVRLRLGQFSAAAEELELEMLHHTRDRLTTVGRPAYEVSNFAAPGDECRHNLNYWTGGDYLALGPSGASHIQGWRWKNRPHLREWETAIDGGNLPGVDIESLTPRQRAGELAMLMLRLEKGVNFADFAARLGSDPLEIFAEPIDRLLKLKLVELTPITLRLTRAGLDVADAVAAEFLSD
jgi:oxygen-independent coproporphyrinogen-3 oxidase